ncbi:c-type cytochrome [Cupriavidus sp. 2TAF22]|uniref:c-type cytochrome n=1 Tax=unclassified Cupriavidus TaxID=2640874 RepID=UPI003F9227FC
MSTIPKLVTAITLLVALPSAQSQDSAALAQKSNCMACHAADKRLVGPSFAEIAARYKDKPDGLAAVATSNRQGSKGTWGGMPMPANPGVSGEQAAELAKWVLAR